MTIAVGDRLPHTVVNVLRDGVQAMDTREIFAGRKVALFAVPGAFTPTCSAKHLPSFVRHMDAFRERGIAVACMAVNDPFVMGAWARQQDVPADLMMLADGNGTFTAALGLEMDASAFGLGKRSKRFSLYADDGVVEKLFIEGPGEYRVSSAEHLLAALA
ncbi:MAG: peroxiredoxin [Proteobacteria bacterium]|nr:peroxiredoxin [Pseudomonadota bacterium]